jgi:acyl carrier protein
MGGGKHKDIPSISSPRPEDRVATPGAPNVNEQEIEAKVIDIVAEQMGVDKSEITRETNFQTDLNADSLDIVELVMEFEDEFETNIPDDQAEKIQNIGQAIDFIKANMNNK